MDHRIAVPLVMLVSLSALTACTRPPMTPPAPVTPVENPVSAPVTPVEMSPSVTPETSTGESTSSSASVTRTEKVSYQSPAGLDEVEFTVTVENDIITSVSSTTLATNPGSKMAQDSFAQNVSAKVVGKSIKDFDVDTIGGASLTTAAFEQFVQSL